MKIHFSIIIIILILIIAIYYFNKERTALISTQNEHYKGINTHTDKGTYMFDSNREKLLDANELRRYINKEGHFKLLRDMSIEDLVKEIDNLKKKTNA